MSKIYLIAGGLLAAASVAFGGDAVVSSRKDVVTSSASVRAPLTIEELFAEVASHTLIMSGAEGTTLFENPGTDVMIVRRNADGSTTHACVEDAAAARRFLSIKPEAVTARSEEK